MKAFTAYVIVAPDENEFRWTSNAEAFIAWDVFIRAWNKKEGTGEKITKEIAIKRGYRCIKIICKEATE